LAVTSVSVCTMTDAGTDTSLADAIRSTPVDHSSFRSRIEALEEVLKALKTEAGPAVKEETGPVSVNRAAWAVDDTVRVNLDPLGASSPDPKGKTDHGTGVTGKSSLTNGDRGLLDPVEATATSHRWPEVITRNNRELLLPRFEAFFSG
jgi:hypothetical protein